MLSKHISLMKGTIQLEVNSDRSPKRILSCLPILGRGPYDHLSSITSTI